MPATLTSINAKTFLLSASISFVSVMMCCLYTLGIFGLSQLISPNMYYTYPYNNMILPLFAFAVSILVYIFFFFAPAVFVGLKKGLGWGLTTFASTVVWAILFLLVLFIVLFFFLPRNNTYPLPTPMMSGSSKAVSVPEEKTLLR